MSDGSLSRRYARALIMLGQEADLTDKFGLELASFITVVELEDGLLRSVLGNPGVTTIERRAVLDEVLTRLDLHQLVQNFLKVLVDKNRFVHLEQISASYDAMADDLARRVRASVTTARALEPGMAARVRQSLESSTGKDVVLTESVDADVLGGMVVRIGDTVFDASVRSRLSSIEQSLLREPGQA